MKIPLTLRQPQLAGGLAGGIYFFIRKGVYGRYLLLSNLASLILEEDTATEAPH